MTRPVYPKLNGGCPVPTCPYMRRTCQSRMHRLYLTADLRGALIVLALIIGLPWSAAAIGYWLTGQPG